MDAKHAAHWGAFTARVANGRLVDVAPFADDPAPSPIIANIPAAVHHACRVARPAIRKGWLEHGPGGNRDRRGAEPFVEVPWDEALDIVAGEVERVRHDHGNAAIFAGSYGWASAGRFHHARTQLHRFLNTVGGFTDQVHTYSVSAGYSILPFVLGSAEAAMMTATGWDSVLAQGELVVAFGGLPLKNMQVAAGGLGEHASGPHMRRARARGVEFVSITPIRQDTADDLGAAWLAIRPNTDVALMLALAHTLEAEGLADRAFLDRYCTGYARFRAYLLGEDGGPARDAGWAAPICEIAADDIRALARRMAGRRTLVTCNWSLQRGDHGEQAFWMTVVLAAMLGQIGLPGGGFGFGYGSMGNVGNPRAATPVPSLTAGANPCPVRIPVARIADMLLHPGASYDFEGRRQTYPDTRLVYWCGGNPFHHHQDLNRLVRAWRRPETVVVHEPWWTPTAKFADIVLPTTTTLERNDIAASGRDRYFLAMQRAIDPVGQARNDHDIFRALAARAGTLEQFAEGRDEAEWLRHLYDRARQQAAENRITLPSFDDFWEEGYAELPGTAEPVVLLDSFRADPERHALRTPSGKIEISSATVDGFGYEDCPGHPAWFEPAEWLGGATARTWPLHLISNQPSTRLHSQMDCGPLSIAGKVAGREPLWMHPDDAARRGLAAGQVVRVFNARGATLAGLVVTDAVRPGVVQLATGAWYDPADPAVEGSLDKHGNPNVLTLDKGSSRLGQGTIAHTTLVEVEGFEGEPPPVTAFAPPKFTTRRYTRPAK